MFNRARAALVILVAATGLAAAAPAANATPSDCPQLWDRYPMDGWPHPDHAETKPFCAYIGYPLDYGDAEANLASMVADDFTSRASAAGYNADERAYLDWIGTDWKSVANGVYSVNILYYVPPFADENWVGYYCQYSGNLSGTTGIGHWSYQLTGVGCSTYTF